ncbi:DUF3817 domain-containing protein [Penaeicola halotolerans]|uniref:DUF3817 domain-containing protein n=1 Tax=Penaeicola halotolerans TaxID=2793196 RepID=UPI001CF8BB4C|nr:DUF3817 domain-containing protein [Penaeicola halotolerans]
MNQNQQLKLISITGIVEGISYLLLLFVAMPLKYFYDMPEAVRYVGMAHGLLFVLFAAGLFQAWLNLGWTMGKAIKGFFYSIIPFGTFIFDKEIKKDIR